MRGEDLLRDFEYINDDLIEEAMEDKNSTESNNTNYSIAKALSGGEKKRFIWRKWGSIAACATVLGISAAAIWVHSNKKLEEIPIKNESSQNIAISEETMTLENAQVQSNIAADESNNKIQENYAASDNMEAAVPEAAVSEASIETNIEDDKIESVQDYDKAVPELAEESTLTTKKQGTEDLEQDDIGNFPSFESSEYTIINDFPPKQPAPDTTDNALIREEYCYKVPEKGTYFYHHELKEAIAYYCGQEDGTQSADMPVCAFQVVVDIFGDQIIPMAEENTNQQNAQEQQSISKQQTTESSKNRLEYAMLSQSDDGKRLLEQEYRRLAAAGYQVVLSTDYRLTGLFTKEELDHFQVSSEYGYAFRFESEL